MEDLKNPIVGFIGAIYDWIDIDLICKLAEAHPDYSILLVGPVNFGKNDLAKHSNILMVGTKRYETLPQYLSYMDVCLIPFKINKLTLASNPIKLYEYLAAGKPVVSTALPEVVNNASHVVLIGKDHADFIQKVEGVVNATPKDDESAKAKRVEFANNNSWDERVQSIKKLLENLRDM
jgi:glycosyltransferase involved in cell wall biosynthesis